jgi:hypothetical protein
MFKSRMRGPGGPLAGGPVAGEAEPSLAVTLQDLQRTAGNRAVEAILAAGGAKEESSEVARVIVPGVGTIPLLSFQFTPQTHTRGREGEPTLPVGDMSFVSKMGPHSTLLHRAMLNGAQVDIEVVVPSSSGQIRIVLKSAIVANYQSSTGGGDEVESWTVSFEGSTFTVEGGAGE